MSYRHSTYAVARHDEAILPLEYARMLMSPELVTWQESSAGVFEDHRDRQVEQLGRPRDRRGRLRASAVRWVWVDVGMALISLWAEKWFSLVNDRETRETAM